MSKKIYLCGKRGYEKYALVEAIDFDYLNQFRWYLDSFGYALRNDKDGKPLRMHAEIMKTPKGLYTDHINLDRLDNRRSNLRVVNMSGNMHNRGPQKNNTSGYKGISWDKRNKRWCASITFNRKHKYIGNFLDIREAVEARTKAEIQYGVMPSKA